MKKIILFLVEGSTDKQSISLTLARLLKKVNVKFHIIKTDITSDLNSTVDNIEKLIFERIDFFLAENPHLTYDDISAVIQITDTDGTFINDSAIVFDSTCEDFTYNEVEIRTNNVEEAKSRNNKKSSILRYLCKKSEIQKVDESERIVAIINYRLYYMSCNLDHVLHDKRNATQEQKEDLAADFEMKTGDNIHLLRDTISKPNVNNSTSFEESWEYIQMGTNSLKRKSNFEYFFQEFVDHN